MCGIIGYVGKKEAAPILLDGLRAMEYRGYDSAGFFISSSGAFKAVGPVQNLATLSGNKAHGTSGIAHTRWATHGVPSTANAHPHSDMSGRIYIVHNGIIENYRELKDELILSGTKFSSETDSEVIAHLIARELSGGTLEEAVQKILPRLSGAYGLAIMDKENPDLIVAVRLGSPLLVGVGKDEMFIASDASPLLHYTRDIIYLNDGEMAIITPDSYRIKTLRGDTLERMPSYLDASIEMAEKGSYPHFMLKEIMEAREVIENSIRGRTIKDEGLVKLGGLELVAEKLKNINRLIIVGCGTAFYAGLVGEYILEEYAGIPVEVEVGSEFRYRKPVIDEHTALLAISQSGETADTLEAVREAKRKGILTLGIVNVVGSTIARETDAGVYNHIGPEIGVASTKAFLSQITILYLLAIFLGRSRSMSLSTGKMLIEEILALPEKIEKTLKLAPQMEALAEEYADFRDFLFIGRKYNYPLAFESALKLKEVSYIHAEGYGAGEMKHGPLAMIEEDFPTFALAPKDSVYEKMVSNMEEIKARKGRIVALTTEGNLSLKTLTKDVIFVPKTIEPLTPILNAIPLQLFAYYVAVSKGLNVDKPRNLAKSVTVE